MFVWQFERFAADFAVELAKGNQRACKRYRADKDAEEHFNQVDGVHFFGNVAHVDKAVEAHQHRRQAHKAVQQGDEFGHFGHFHFFGFVDAQRRADEHGDDNPAQARNIIGKNGGKQRNRHAGDA